MIALSAATWSITSFLFGVGFVSRIDPSLVQVLTLSDIFGIALSYVVYLVPIGVLLVIMPWQFFMPVPISSKDHEVEFGIVPTLLFRRFNQKFSFIPILLLGIWLPVLMLIDMKFHIIDRSSLFYMIADFMILPLFMALMIIIAFKNSFVPGISKAQVLLGLGITLVFSGAYLGGDYMSSLRMNHPSQLDCAVIENNGNRCTPILLWGSSHFITWRQNRLRAVPVNKIDHIWLHPNKLPDPRRIP